MRSRTSLRGTLLAALLAFTAVLGVLTPIAGYSSAPLVAAVQFLAVVGLGVIIIGGAVVLAVVHLADWRAPEREFELIVQRTERMAAGLSWDEAEEDYGTEDDPYRDEEDYLADLEEWTAGAMGSQLTEEEEFRMLVRSVVDALPLELHGALEHVAIIVTDAGAGGRVTLGRRGPYGARRHRSEAEDYFNEQVLIFRDRLVRDFGDDQQLLRERILRTLCVQLAPRVGGQGAAR
ncbi:MAG: hypothetical protein ACRDKL_07200 [Solirubrobacteraceae bacterium]